MNSYCSLSQTLETQPMVLGYALIHKVVKSCLKLYSYGELFIYCFKHFLSNVT